MADITVTTNGTVEGTKLSVDGKDVTKKEKVTSISLYSSAPYKSSYDNETYPGYSSVSYTVANEDGTMERKEYFARKDDSAGGIGQKMKAEDSVIQFMGHEADVETAAMVDKIIAHCTAKEIACPDREILLSRSIESLTDKATDLGLVISDEEGDEGKTVETETNEEEEKNPENEGTTTE